MKKRRNRTKITVRVDPHVYDFIKDRATNWNCAITRFTEEMVEQGVQAEKKRETNPAWLSARVQDVEERTVAEPKQEKETVSEEELLEQKQIDSHHYGFFPKEAIRAYLEGERRKKEQAYALRKGLEPPKHEKGVWEEFFETHGTEPGRRWKRTFYDDDWNEIPPPQAQ